MPSSPPPLPQNLPPDAVPIVSAIPNATSGKRPEPSIPLRSDDPVTPPESKRHARLQDASSSRPRPTTSKAQRSQGIASTPVGSRKSPLKQHDMVKQSEPSRNHPLRNAFSSPATGSANQNQSPQTSSSSPAPVSKSVVAALPQIELHAAAEEAAGNANAKLEIVVISDSNDSDVDGNKAIPKEVAEDDEDCWYKDEHAPFKKFVKQYNSLKYSKEYHSEAFNGRDPKAKVNVMNWESYGLF
jgi:hypothetical protein